MNTHSPTRRGPKVLAITAIMALLSLLGFAAPAQAATPVVVTRIAADSVVMQRETKNMIHVDWKAAPTDSNASVPPIEFTIDLPSGLEGNQQDIPMPNPTDRNLPPVGLCKVRATTVTCSVNESYILANPLNIKGTIDFEVWGKNSGTESVFPTITHGDQNLTIEVTVPAPSCVENCVWQPDGGGKFGWYLSNPDEPVDKVDWYVYLPGYSDTGLPPGAEVTVEDYLDPTQYKISEGYPRLVFATEVTETAYPVWTWGLETVPSANFDYTDDGEGNHRVTFTAIDPQVYSGDPGAAKIGGSIYFVLFKFDILDRTKSAEHHNTATWAIEDQSGTFVANPVSRPAGGATVVGENEGQFTLSKVLNSADNNASILPQDFDFTVTATAPGGTPEESDASVSVGGDPWISPIFPAGTEISISENLPESPTNISWQTAWSSEVINAEGSTIDFTIEGNFLGKTTAITATNTATLHRGSIDIHKVLTAPAAALPALPEYFDVEYSWPADEAKAIPAGSGTVPLNADGTTRTITGIPVGAVVSFKETGLEDTTSYKWSTPSFSPETVTLTATNQSIDVTLTNTATLKTGDFVISKSLDVTPEVAALIPDGYEFTVDYSWAANADLGIAEGEGTVAVPADGTEVTVEDLPVGAVVSFEEVDLPGIGNNTWATPKFSPETVTIEEGSTPVSLNLTNKSSLNTGEIVINKVLEAPEYAFSALPTSFEVDYSWPANSDLGFPAGEGTVTLAANGESKTIADVPVGAVVTFTETTPSDTTSYAWNTPTFSPSASVTVEEAEQSVEVTLTNSVTPKLGSVDVFKELNAPAAATPLLPESYTVNYSWEEDAELGITGGEGSVTVIPGDEPTSINDLPVGAVITFEEVTPAAVPSHTWSDPVYSDESVTVGSGDAVSFTVTNSLKLDVGSLAVKKKVVAPAEAAGLLPATYPVTYSWDANPELGIEAFSATIDLPGDGTPVELNEVPVDAIVKFREGSVAAIGSYEWATPVFSAADVVLADTSEPIEIELTNVAMLQTRSISINKAVVAPEGVTALLPESYEVTYSWPANTELGFLAGEGTVTLPADGTLVEIADVPLGAVLTFVESALPGIGSNEWQTPVFSDNNIVVGAEGSATSVTVTNTAELLTGSISINKIVEAPEEASGLLPAEYPVTYTWEANNELGFLAGSGSVALPADGSPIVIEGVPVGAVVNFVEDALPTIGSNVWETPVFSANNVTVTEAGQEVAVSLTNTAVLQTGSITIHKIVEAPKDATGLLPSEYPVFYTWAANADLGFAEGSGSLMLAADGTPQTVSAIPLGAVVTFEEGELPAIEGFEWSAPTFSENDVVVSEAGADVALSLTNTLAPEPEEGQLPDVEESTPPTQGGSELPKTGASGLVTGGAIAIFLGLLGLMGVRVASKRQH